MDTTAALATTERATAPAAVTSSLHRAAKLAAWHEHADGLAYPWHRRPPASFVKLCADLAERYAPATANASLAAVRGALRVAWLAGALDPKQA